MIYDDLSSNDSSILSDDEQELGYASEEANSQGLMMLAYASEVRLSHLFNLCIIFTDEESEEFVNRIRRWIDANKSDETFLKKAAGYIKDGFSPLHYVCMTSKTPLDVVQTLIAYAPETLQMQESEQNNLPLHLLCYHSDSDNFFEIAKAMVEAYPDSVTVKNSIQRLPIHQVCDCRSMISNLGKKLQILDFLIEKYHESIFFNDIGNLSPSEVLRFTIEIYLENNQNDIQNKNEHMLLLHQIIAGEFSLNLVKFFLDALPGSCKLQDVNGMTPLHHACIHGKYGHFIAILLLLVSVWPHSCVVEDNYGRTPAQLFREEASSRKDNGMLAMHHLARRTKRRGKLTLLFFLLQSYPEGVSMPDHSGMLPFHYAALNGASSIEFIMELVRFYPDCINQRIEGRIISRRRERRNPPNESCQYAMANWSVECKIPVQERRDFL